MGNRSVGVTGDYNIDCTFGNIAQDFGAVPLVCLATRQIVGVVQISTFATDAHLRDHNVGTAVT